MKLEFGLKVRDKITGFEGTVDGHCVYMTGCSQWRVLPVVDKEGKMQNGHWIDEDRLEEVVGKPVTVTVEHPSGPVDCPPPLW